MAETFSSQTINGIPAYILSTSKYKTNYISVYIRQPLEEEHHTKIPLISAVLKRGTEGYPSAQTLRQTLEKLYGASLDIDVMKRGEQQVLVFRLQLANEKFLSDQRPLFEEGMKMLNEVMTRPLVENGAFASKNVELERDILRQKLSQLKDDKMRYANKRCVEEMFKDEKFRLFTYGSLEQLDQLSAADLYSYYQQMLQSHPIDIFVIGDIDPFKAETGLRNRLQISRQTMTPSVEDLTHHHVQEEREVIEKTKISQGKLHIGCRTHTAYRDEDYTALLVSNGIFGGFSHSKLFRNVREKHSLAYYAMSSIESHKGLMMIAAGIDFKNYDQTVDIIKQELQKMVEGDITAEELSQTKAMLINQIKESNDQPYSLMERHFHGIIGGIIRSSDQLIDEIEQVTTEDISRVSKKIEMDTIYFLTSAEEEAHS